MDKTKIGSTGWELPPLRTLDDFLLESARFQLPNYRDIEKWGNRVASNLLYYQTNYFLMAIIIFLIVGLIHPGKMIVGLIAMAVVFAVFAHLLAKGGAIHHFKKQHPLFGTLIVCGFICLGGCFVIYTLGSLLVALLGILMPFSAIFIHSSMRLRNLKNKMANKIEGIGLTRTPMSAFLEHLGMEPDMFD